MTDEQLVEKYSKLCTHIAWSFITKSKQFIKLGYSDQASRQLNAQDAEDFASDALLKLLKCPERYRDQHSYVLRLIINAVINSHKKRYRCLSREFTEAFVGLKGEPVRHWEDLEVMFSIAPHRAGTPTTFSYEEPVRSPYGLANVDVSRLDFSSLTEPELTVLRLHFGLDGGEGLSEKVIARKLGRTQWWAQARLRQGLQKLRQSTVKNT